MSNKWLDAEINEMCSEIRMHENDRKHKTLTAKHEKSVMLKLMGFCAVFFCCFGIFLTASPVIQCRNTLHTKTWKCKKCGYENYEGICPCPCCDTGR